MDPQDLLPPFTADGNITDPRLLSLDVFAGYRPKSCPKLYLSPLPSLPPVPATGIADRRIIITKVVVEACD